MKYLCKTTNILAICGIRTKVLTWDLSVGNRNANRSTEKSPCRPPSKLFCAETCLFWVNVCSLEGSIHSIGIIYLSRNLVFCGPLLSAVFTFHFSCLFTITFVMSCSRRRKSAVVFFCWIHFYWHAQYKFWHRYSNRCNRNGLVRTKY